MQTYRRGSWEDQLLGEGLGWMVVLAVLVVAAAITLLVAAATELARICERSAAYSEETIRVVKMTVVMLLCSLVLSGVLVVTTTFTAIGMYVASWSFLGCVLVLEWCDWRERRSENKANRELNDLDTYLEFTEPGGIATGVGRANKVA